MKAFIKKIKDNLFILIIGFVYYFSFSGISVGDVYYRSLENGYPLFFVSNFDSYPLWFGFDIMHFLSIPTLRAIQLLIAKMGLLPNPLLLMQLVNLFLALVTLKLIHSILLHINIGNFMATVTTVLFGFSYGFYANMNAEMHHFSVFLIILTFWLLLNIEREKNTSGYSIFMVCLCLALTPLYHIETIVYSACIILYILFQKKLRRKFISKIYPVILGIIVCPVILITISFIFHYFELGATSFTGYISELPERLQLNISRGLTTSIYSSFSLKNIYIMSRAHLESFSVISRCAKILQHYKDILFYSNAFFVKATVSLIILYILSFLIVNVTALISIIKNWSKVKGRIKLLVSMLIVYLVGFGLFHNKLLSEFYIVSVAVHCLLLGYVFNKQIRRLKIFYYFLIILTIISNTLLFIYPQKVSAKSINRIFDEIESENIDAEEIVVVRVSSLNFTYELGARDKFKIYSDEHAYFTEAERLRHINSIHQELNNGKKVYLISPAFLIGDSKEVNFNSVLPMDMDEFPDKFKNLQYFLEYVNDQHQTTVIKKYDYNFGALGQLGRLAVIELKGGK